MTYYGYDYDEMMDRCREEINAFDVLEGLTDEELEELTDEERKELVDEEAKILCKVWLGYINDKMPNGYVFDADTGMIDRDTEDDEEVDDYDKYFWDDLIEDSWDNALPEYIQIWCDAHER